VASMSRIDSPGMISQTYNNPPLSPHLLAGLGLGAMPPALLQPFLDAALVMMKRRHPGLFTRLEALAGSTFRIDPTDLPFDFVLHLAPAPSLTAVSNDASRDRPTASIHGPLLSLIKLMEGKLDGDALFFSRDLVVEGDTEAVVTLRNAIDGAGIDLVEDLAWASGPFAGPLRRAARAAESVFARANRDLAVLRRAFLSPVAERCERQAEELRELQEKMAELQRKQASATPAGRRHGHKRDTRKL